MFKKLFLLTVIMLIGFSYSIGFVKPVDYDIESGEISSFAEIMPGQVLEISLLSTYDKESITNVALGYDNTAFSVGNINYGNPFIDISLNVKDAALPGNYKLNFDITTNNGKRTIDAYVMVSKSLIRAQLFFVGNEFSLHNEKDFKVIVENPSDGAVSCIFKSNLADSWILYKKVELKPRETKELSNVFIANNIGDYDIDFCCENQKGINLFSLNKKLKIITTHNEEEKFQYFAYPIINNSLSPFYAILNYLSQLY